jgi:prepilin-type N-terminal cleavage/methylation domain-containing protein
MTAIASQNAVAQRPATPRVPASPRPRVSFRRRGFTLIEMLIVMGIIILAITLAIPTIRALTGSKSTQSAQNTIAAYLASTRSDAIGLQQTRGVIFLLDQTSGRITLAEVGPSQSITQLGIVVLDLVPDRDPLPLPPGVGAWTIKDRYFPTGAADPFPTYRYLGYNPTSYTGSTTTDKAMIGGVILFNGYGNVLVSEYGFAFSNGSTSTALGNMVFTAPSATQANWPTTTPLPYLRSQVGFVLFDRATFQTQQPAGTANPDGNTTTAATINTLNDWLDANTTPILVDRYNGTLMVAE